MAASISVAGNQTPAVASVLTEMSAFRARGGFIILNAIFVVPRHAASA